MKIMVICKNNLKKLSFLISHFSTPRGFTLIELIVVFSTITFLSTIGIASYVSYSQSQSLQVATQDLVTTIALAKSRANSQVKPRICDDQTLDGYSITVSIANSTYTLNVVCSGNSYPLSITKLPKNITFHQDTTTEVFFAVISGAVKGGGIGIKDNYGRTKFIEVDSVGLIAQVSGIPTQPPPTPTPTPTPLPTKKVFVTSTSSINGDLVTYVKNNIDAAFSGNGLQAGNRICKWRADNATPVPLGGTWIAWLSDSTTDAKDRISAGKYVRNDDGALIANDKTDLTNGDIAAAISIDENGNNLGSNSVWTGTDQFGNKLSIHCNDWISNNVSINGGYGDSVAISSDWTEDHFATCNAGFKLYCFED